MLATADATRVARIRRGVRAVRAGVLDRRRCRADGRRTPASRRGLLARAMPRAHRRRKARLHAAGERVVAATSQLPTLSFPADLARPAHGSIARHFGLFGHERSKTTLSRRGIDFDVDEHQPAYAPADGTVRYAGPIRGLGHGVIIDAAISSPWSRSSASSRSRPHRSSAATISRRAASRVPRGARARRSRRARGRSDRSSRSEERPAARTRSIIPRGVALARRRVLAGAVLAVAVVSPAVPRPDVAVQDADAFARSCRASRRGLRRSGRREELVYDAVRGMLPHLDVPAPAR
jgi:hypothetical protein